MTNHVRPPTTAAPADPAGAVSMSADGGDGFLTTLIRFLVENPEFISLVTPAVILLSVIVAIFGVRRNSAMTKQRATLDLIERTETTQHYLTAAETFRKYRKREGGLSFSDLTAPGNDAQKIKDRKAVIGLLNHYEIIAIGIKRGILSASFYKLWMRSVFCRNWEAAADFIWRERWKKTPDDEWHYYKQMFEHFEQCALKWGAQRRLAKGNPPKDVVGEGAVGAGDDATGLPPDSSTTPGEGDTPAPEKGRS